MIGKDQNTGATTAAGANAIRRSRRAAIATAGVLVGALVAAIAATAWQPALAGERGVVLMHGKWGTSRPKSPVGLLARDLEDAGIAVIAPDMPWSRSRLYDRDFNAVLKEIDDAVAVLRGRGATRIVVGGHSLGANIAIAYGARRDGLAGVLAIAPGHRPEAQSLEAGSSGPLARARKLVAAGRGGDKVGFTDVNQGRARELSVGARTLVDFFAPDGPAVMPLNAPRLRPGTAFMWIVGEKDRIAALGKAYVFDLVPRHPNNAYVVVPGGHKATPTKGWRQIVAWLKRL